MADMKQLAGLIKELEDQLVVCMRCGMCQAVCPVYAETGREADVARGKLALLDGLVQEGEHRLPFLLRQGAEDAVRRVADANRPVAHDVVVSVYELVN